MRARVAFVTAVLATSTGCGAESDGWTRVQDAPIPPRVPAVAIWTGEEVLFLGGDTDPCPASASCVTPTVAPLADGAALDPSTGT